MGCQPSNELPEQECLTQTETEQEWKISYRQFIPNSRGQVFQFYHLSTVISKGKSSIIRQAIKKSNQQMKICKIIPIPSKRSVFTLYEIEVLKKFSHPNIVQVHQFFLESDFLYIIMENIQGNKILDELKLQSKISFTDIVSIMKQLLSAVEYCHKKMIVHRTINTGNVLLLWKNKPIVKVIDFSQTTQKDCPKPFPVNPHKQNFLCDPECQNSVDIDKIDIRDCGLIFYYILTGEKPCKTHIFKHYQNDYLQILHRVLQNLQILQSQVKKNLYELIEQMLHLDRSKRLTSQECLNHKFFKKFEEFQSKSSKMKDNLQEKIILNMLNFQVNDKLKSLVYMYFSLNLTTIIEKTEYLNEFYNLDSNNDGEIQYQELVEGLKNTFNCEDEKAKEYASKIFLNLDKDKNGSLDFNEFVMGSMDISKIIEQQTIKKIFKELDINKDKQLERKEINELVVGIEGFDLMDGRKSVTFAQFKEMMTKIVKIKEKQRKKSLKMEEQ